MREFPLDRKSLQYIFIYLIFLAEGNITPPIPQIPILIAASFFCQGAVLFLNMFNLKGINATYKINFNIGQQ